MYMGVRHLEADDHQANPARSQYGPLSPGNSVGHRRQVADGVSIEIRPVVDCGSRHDQHMTAVKRSHIHESHAHIVSPHEASRYFSLDDLGENRRHDYELYTLLR